MISPGGRRGTGTRPPEIEDRARARECRVKAQNPQNQGFIKEFHGEAIPMQAYVLNVSPDAVGRGFGSFFSSKPNTNPRVSVENRGLGLGIKSRSLHLRICIAPSLLGEQTTSLRANARGPLLGGLQHTTEHVEEEGG